ncbi:MAG: outer membrane beta-barrel protein [Gemmatimonadetes bacterium]|nr:outer membrane beta-barrel protein [Gemmatimonadota bacterium]
MSRLSVLSAVLMLAAGTPLVATNASAQIIGSSAREQASREIVSILGYGGGFTPANELAGPAEFSTSGTVGGAVTVWFGPYVGIRGNGLYTQSDVDGASSGLALRGEEPNVWIYSGDVLLRLPLTAGQSSWWYPYVVGGLGGKTYDFDRLDTETDFAGNFGGGIEFRVNRYWGIQAEARDFVSSFDRLGIDSTQHDVVYTGGISLTF